MSEAESGLDELQKRLERIEYDTITGDACTGVVQDVTTARSSRRERIVVTIELPSGRVRKEEFDMPQTASERYGLVRLLKSVGLTLGQIADLRGKEVLMEMDAEGTFRLAVPDRERSPRDVLASKTHSLSERRLGQILLLMTLACWPITGLRVYPKWHQTKHNRPPGVFDWLMEYGFSALLYGLVLLVSYALVMTMVSA